MKEIILLKDGELVLKGLNRRTFEDILAKNIKKTLRNVGTFQISRSQSVMRITPEDDFDVDEGVTRLRKVFGITSVSRACVSEKNIESIKKAACTFLKNDLESVTTFKVEAKRGDKLFPIKSPEICCEVGERILDRFPHLSVDVRNPQLTVMVEVRDLGAYVHGDPMSGAGGLPVGTGGKAAILISGGIDSPVAAWMMAKRGVSLTAIHFASPPYTSERAEEKVITLLEKVSKYSGHIKLIIVPFTQIQEAIKNECPEEHFTIIMRRMMMRIAQKLAQKEKCAALITGESLGQVASQTINAIACTDAVTSIPVFRPLIGMDKDEIVSISRKIDTFETSILPYEDCCTVFTPKHPTTRPEINKISLSESGLDIEALIVESVGNIRYMDIEG